MVHRRRERIFVDGLPFWWLWRGSSGLDGVPVLAAFKLAPEGSVRQLC
jgi:hypothetical protein